MIGINGKKVKVLGICTASLHKEDVIDTVSAIVESCKKQGMKALILNAFSDMFKLDAFARHESSVYCLAGSSVVDAVVVMPEAIKNDAVSMPLIRRAKERGIPVISVDRKVDGCFSVTYKYADSFGQIVRHVITEHNCKVINFVAGPKGNTFSEERIARFREIMAEYGIPFDERRLDYGDFWEQPAERVAESWFKSDLPLPEAVICANDSMAMAVCSVLKRHGLKIPRDIIVTGFDGIRLEKYHTPRLTTCAISFAEVGKTVVDAANALIDGAPCAENAEIPFRLRIAQSCGCHKIRSAVIADRIMELNTEMVGVDAHEEYMFSYLNRALDSKDLDALADTIKEYAHVATWVSVDTGFFSESRRGGRFGSFGERMQLFTSTEKNFVPGTFYSTEVILPDLADILADTASLMVCPLHSDSEVIGYITFNIKIGSYDLRRVRRFLMLTDQIFEAVKARRTIEKANEKLAVMHIHDPMTGVLNRRGFYQKASALIRKLSKSGQNAVIFSADMDGLKQINDNYGHDMGDKAIKAMANALVRTAGEEGICSRFGGDEFIVLSQNTDKDFIESFAEKVQTRLDNYTKRVKTPFRIVVSIGVLDSNMSSFESLDECIRIADEKMYSVKHIHKRS